MKSHFLLFFLASLIGGCVVCCKTETKTDVSAADIVMVTEVGEVYIRLFDETPQHKANFLKLARAGFFDSTAFHRVVYEFVVQGGDPRTRDQYPPRNTARPNDAGYTLASEIVDSFAHIRGMLGAAREPDAQNPGKRSSSSQFYIVTGRPVLPADLDLIEANRREEMQVEVYEAFERDTTFEGTFIEYTEAKQIKGFRYTPAQRATYLTEGGAPNLDGAYTIFGEVIAGMDAIRQVEISPTGGGELPQKPIYILSVKVLADTPKE